MLALTHILFVLLIIKLLDLDSNEAFVAMLFGVLIDLDHFLGIPGYIHQNGAASITDTSALIASDVQWKSLLHKPIAILVVAPVSTAFRYLLPLLLWGSHILMDWLQEAYLGLLSVPEVLFILGALTLYAWLEVKSFMQYPRVKWNLEEFARWERDKWVNGILEVVPKRSPRPRNVRS